ncbi:MAG TPA: TonB-dependent receptor [Bacteroidia bacterium]|jgi:iron complex outermembrane receptor protein|nr:TonB-dependent receptor [Bacteroidia bacterium]
MTRILFFILTCFALSSLSAQSYGVLKGTVIDGTNRDALAGATVVDERDKSVGTVSDVNGNFECKIKPGKHRFICSYIGMMPDTFGVLIDSAAISIYNVILHSSSRNLNIVVVSAGKFEQKLEDITVSMEVLRPDLIEQKNTTSIDKALEQVPGLNILDSEPQIRGGSGFSFGVGSRVATLIDGMPILSGDAGKTEWTFIPMENIEQVEVIKGASSVLYGSAALSGTINIRTADAKDKPITKGRLYAGVYSAPSDPSAKWWGGTAGFSGANAFHAERIKQIDYTIGINGTYDHNYIGPNQKTANKYITIDSSITEKTVAQRSARFNFNFKWRPKKVEGLAIGLNGNFMQSHNNFSLVWGNDSSGIYKSYPHTMTIQDITMGYLDPYVTYYTKGGFKHNLRARYFYTLNNLTNNQSNLSNMLYGEYQFAKELNAVEGLNFTGGVVMNQTFVNSKLYSASGSRNNHLENWAAYTQLDKKLWKVLNLSLGFRGEYFRINGTEDVIKPIFRSGLNLKLAKATFLRYSYGQGYRYPTIAEKFIFTNAGGITIYPNPHIQPETSWNTEVGLKQGFKIGHFYGYLDAAAFWQEYSNTIEYIYAVWRPDSVGFKFVNTGDTRVRGIELSFMGEGKLSKDIALSILGGYTYCVPQSINPSYVFATDNPSPGSTPTRLSYSSTSTDTSNNILKYRFQHIAKIDVQLSWKSISIGGSVRYYSFMQNIDRAFYNLDQPNQPGSGIKAYRIFHNQGVTVYDARIGWKISQHYKTALVVNNLFNLEYSLRPLKIEAPRTIALQVSCEF